MAGFGYLVQNAPAKMQKQYNTKGFIFEIEKNEMLIGFFEEREDRRSQMKLFYTESQQIVNAIDKLYEQIISS